MRLQLSKLIIIIAFGGNACHSDSFKPETSRPSTATQPLQANAADTSEDDALVADRDSAESDAVALPIPVTGAYLSCQEIETGGDPLKRQIGCRSESNGVMIEDLESRVSAMAWSLVSQGSSVTIQANDTIESPIWQKIFDVQAAPNSVLTDITIELSFQYNGQSIATTTRLAVIWDADCALPPIDFEAVSGQNFFAGMPVTDQFAASHGVRFSTLSGAPVLLGGYGANDPVAYYGGPDNTANYLADHQNAGKFFITDGHKQSDATDTLVVTYDDPTDAAALDLVDIDFSETYVVRAFNANDELVDEVQIESPVDNYRDGQMTRFIVRAADPTNLIQKLHIFGFIPTGLSGIGFGVDNFSPRCAR